MRTILITLLLTLATQVQGHHELANRNLENGFNNYQEYCASCHGVNLEGQANWRSRNQDGTLPAPPHDETGHTWHRVENSHLPFRRRERAMLRFRRMHSLQKFASIHASFHNLFNSQRSLSKRSTFKINLDAAFTEWRSLLTS